MVLRICLIFSTAMLISCFSDMVNSAMEPQRTWDNPIDSLSVFAHLRGPTLIDPRDGKTYRTLILGNRLWMAQDLQYGDSSQYTWANALLLPDSANQRLASLPDSTICPPGWHLPTIDEWQTLLDSFPVKPVFYDSASIYKAPDYFRGYFGFIHNTVRQDVAHGDQYLLISFSIAKHPLLSRDGLALTPRNDSTPKSYWSATQSGALLSCSYLGNPMSCVSKAYAFVASSMKEDPDFVHGFFGTGPLYKHNKAAVRCMAEWSGK